MGFNFWKTDINYFTFCEPSKPSDVFMFKCADKEVFTLDKGCWFTCPGRDRYAHEKNDRYYDCSATGGTYKLFVCDKDFMFDLSMKDCVPKFTRTKIFGAYKQK